MSTNWNGETAKVLQFPEGGRRGLAGRRATARAIEELEAALPKVSFGDGWYHEAAMQEAAGAGKR